MNIVITGSSRGIGLGLVKIFLKYGHNVIATCRKPNKAIELQKIQKLYSNSCEIIYCDVANKNSMINSIKLIKKLKFGQYIDILINNAGVATINHPNDNPFITSYDEFQRLLNVNTLGPFQMIQSMETLLEQSKQPIIVNISSSLGSITLNKHSESTAYGASKAALNYLTKSVQNAKPNWIVVALSPGWIQTDMGNYNNRKAEITIEDCVNNLYNTISKLTINDQGKFIHRDKSILPW